MPHFQYASDQSLLLTFGNEISMATHVQVRKLLRSLELDKPAGVRNLHPAYCSLMLRFDPCRTCHEELEREIAGRRLDEIALPEPRMVEIPVVYGGPDLDDVAQLHGITSDEVVRLHSGAIYTVYFLGFVPGFAYLGGMPDAIATPRLSSPRKRVEAGSVGIGGNQTGIYPVSTPGGWRLIGKTPLAMFQAERENMSLLAIGDQVRFRPIEGA
ncbi:MAG: 5-oxoprolinase subunit PxpB [Bryobacteraceae bacterium]